MLTNVDAALAFILKDEGGYAERPEEGGGAVNRGITFAVFRAWRLSAGKPEPTWADLKAMPIEETKAIYTTQYLNGIHFNELPSGVDYFVMDGAVLGGVGGSLTILQKALGLKPDGHYGLVTNWAVNHRPIPALLDKLAELRIAQYKKFKTFDIVANPKAVKEKQKTWGQIWTERTETVRKRSMSLVTGAAIAPVLAAPAIIKASGSFPPAISKMPASNALSKGMVKRGGTVQQFLAYLKEEVEPQMGAWRPRGIVFHNTGTMKWLPTVKHSNGTSEVLTPQQQLDNMSVNWLNNHFPSTPHLVIPPTGEIWVCWPLWKRGTHSPSWNQTHWGIETMGDWSKEVPTPALINATVTAAAGMMAMLGHIPNDDTFKFHKEDPLTTHKQCPGPKFGTKAAMITNVTAAMRSLNPLA